MPLIISKDDIFMFQVGKKGKVVDATEVTSSNKADDSVGRKDALEKKAAAAAAVATIINYKWMKKKRLQ